MYRPNPVPRKPEEVPQFLNRELDQLQKSINGKWSIFRLQPLAAEPKKYAPGDLVYADGANWNPGSGEGPYIRTSIAWVPMF